MIERLSYITLRCTENDVFETILIPEQYISDRNKS